MSESSPPAAAGLVRGLGGLAATALVIGDVVGTGVFLKARVMTCNVGSAWLVMAVWVVAALLSVAGALTYAELAAMMPSAGGEYVFIREAYGRLAGFLYGWTRFFVSSTGAIAGLAAGFAIFINILTGGVLEAHGPLLHLPAGLVLSSQQGVAIGAIALVTLINCGTVSASGRVALVLTAAKIALLLAIGFGGMLLGHGAWGHFDLAGTDGTCEGVAAAARGGVAGFGAAMIGALWAYTGWNEVTFVAEEVKNPRTTLPLALVGGIGVVAGLYVLVNTAYFYVLSPVEVASVPLTSSVATSAVSRALGPAAATLMAGVLAMSIFGALQIASLVCARIPFAMARDGMFFAPLRVVDRRTHVPVRALAAQGVWASALVLTGSYDVLTDYTTVSILIFVCLGGAAVFVLRRRSPDAVRPYRTWGYPVVPVVFLAVSAWLVANTLATTPWRTLAGVGLTALGLPFYRYWSRRAPRAL